MKGMIIMKDKFFNKKVAYFWEYEYPFGEVFLREIFKDNYKRKYSLSGEGIFDLILSNNKIYYAKFSQSKSMLKNDGKKAFRDTDKDFIVEKICNSLKEENIDFSVNSGKFITFENNNFIFKIELIKKSSIPE